MDKKIHIQAANDDYLSSHLKASPTRRLHLARPNPSGQKSYFFRALTRMSMQNDST
jgi:hypothetical protein